VLEIVLAASQNPDSWKHVREVLEREVKRQRPESLVIDLSAFDSVYGMALVGALVVGAAAMRQLGTDRRTRLVARAHVAGRLAEVLRIAKMDVLFDGRIYSDVEAALEEPSRYREEPPV
jgi:hypothetical protein